MPSVLTSSPHPAPVFREAKAPGQPPENASGVCPMLDAARISVRAGDSQQEELLAFIPFQPEHLRALRLQKAQTYLRPLLEQPGYGATLSGPYSWTAALDGKPIGCAGLLPQWPGRAIAWALLTPQLDARHFPRAHGRARAVLHAAQRDGMWRIEASVDAAFDAGHRWALALGFTPEGLMRRFSPEGRDHLLYARISSEGIS